MAKPTDKSRDRVPVDFDVFGSGTKETEKIKFLFNEIGGRHQFIIDNVDKNNTTETVERKVKLGVDYKVTVWSLVILNLLIKRQNIILNWQHLDQMVEEIIPESVTLKS